jgi:hypothetical protein
VNNIKMDLWEIEWDCMDLINVTQDRDQWRAFVNTVMNLRVSSNAWKLLSSCKIGGFSRRAQLREWVSEWASEWVSVLTVLNNHPHLNLFKIHHRAGECSYRLVFGRCSVLMSAGTLAILWYIRDFPHFLQRNTATVPRLGYDRLLSNPF